mgnify:CR=1 FL=1
MSVEFFGVGGPNQIGNLKKTQKPSTDKSTESSQADKVEFSSVLQDVKKANAAQESAQAKRAERVEQLKAQIADGSYKPDLDKVASSLVQYLTEGK